MENYTEGLLEEKKNMRRSRILYGSFAALGFVAFVVYLVTTAEISNGKDVQKQEFCFMIFCFVYLFILLVLLVRSALKMKNALDKTRENRIKRWQMVTIVTVYALLMIVQLIYALLWAYVAIVDVSERQNAKYELMSAQIARIYVWLVCKVIMFKILASFGSGLSLKSVVRANGDLVIVGEDQTGKQKFVMVMKAATHQSRLTFSGDETGRNSVYQRDPGNSAALLDDENYEDLMDQAMDENLQWRQMDEDQAEELAIASQFMNINN